MNQYMLYSYAAQDFHSACDDKILVDLSRLKQMKEFSDVDKFVTSTFGQIDDYKLLNYPKNVVVYVKREPNIIIVEALQDTKHIFGLKWTYTPPAEKDN